MTSEKQNCPGCGAEIEVRLDMSEGMTSNVEAMCTNCCAVVEWHIDWHIDFTLSDPTLTREPWTGEGHSPHCTVTIWAEHKVSVPQQECTCGWYSRRVMQIAQEQQEAPQP